MYSRTQLVMYVFVFHCTLSLEILYNGIYVDCNPGRLEELLKFPEYGCVPWKRVGKVSAQRYSGRRSTGLHPRTGNSQFATLLLRTLHHLPTSSGEPTVQSFASELLVFFGKQLFIRLPAGCLSVVSQETNSLVLHILRF